MPRLSTEERFHDAIEYAVNEYGDHGDLRRARVIRWLEQFSYRARPLAAKVLQSLDYYAASNVHAMAQQLVRIIHNDFARIPKQRIVFVPIGAAGSGAQQVARHLRMVQAVPNGSVIDLLTLHRKSPDDVDVIVAFDDFSGTGETIKGWWDTNESIIRPKNATVVIALLVLNHTARPTLEEITDRIISVNELLADANVFHEQCEKLTAREKNSLLQLCRRTRCSKDYLRGRGDCGLLVVFKHGCPNNSIPILWHTRTGTFEALFQRRNA